MFQKRKRELQYVLLLCAVLLVQAIRYFPFKFGGWNQVMLSFSYRYGFIQRAFLGSILDLESTLFHIPLRYMRYIYGISTVFLFSVLYLGIAYYFICQKLDSNTETFLKTLILVFLWGPGWSTIYSNFGHTDTWLIIISILSMMVLLRKKGAFFSLLFTLIGILIHPVYLLLYWNGTMMLVLYQCITNWKDLKSRKKYLSLFLLNLCLAGILFFFLLFFSHVKEDLTIEYVMNRTAEFVSKSLDQIEDERPFIEEYLFRMGKSENVVQNLFPEYKYRILSMLIVFSPFIFELVKLWKLVVSKAKKDLCSYWWMYVLIPLGCATTIPVFIMQNDFGRWTYAVIFYEMAMIFLLIQKRDIPMFDAIHSYMQQVRSKKGYYFCLAMYAAVLGGFSQNLVNDAVTMLEQLFSRL